MLPSGTPERRLAAMPEPQVCFPGLMICMATPILNPIGKIFAGLEMPSGVTVSR